eukprot:4001971-Amphidinium_carterae.1
MNRTSLGKLCDETRWNFLLFWAATAPNFQSCFLVSCLLSDLCLCEVAIHKNYTRHGNLFRQCCCDCAVANAEEALQE